jgi:hypothetical protein
VLDLGAVGRRYPRIRNLPVAPQLADHVAFGLVVGSVLASRLHATFPDRIASISVVGRTPKGPWDALGGWDRHGVAAGWLRLDSRSARRAGKFDG